MLIIRIRNVVVYRSIPTSNRNFAGVAVVEAEVVYRSIPTSNRNYVVESYIDGRVVYRSIPTSNRNGDSFRITPTLLYIVLFLHQTATEARSWAWQSSCISFYSYIKPQLLHKTKGQRESCISFYSYIKPQH